MSSTPKHRLEDLGSHVREGLKVGDSSPRVAEVRSTLARLGIVPADEAEVPNFQRQQFRGEDTYFDAELEEMLRAFQQTRGIVPSGLIDDTTLRELRHASYSLGARPLFWDKNSPLIGDDVAQLQNQLQELGFYSDRIDGHFGEATHTALVEYQINYGLETDGVCAKDTLRALSLLGRRVTGGSPQAIKERETVRVAGPQLTGKRVVIDPSLGGPNHGQTVRGRFGEITEEELLWDLATRVDQRMKAAGMETMISRPRNDDPSAADRADIANAIGADLVISLACDHYRNDKANGVASFYFGSEIGASSMTGETLSGFLQREIVARTNLVNCGNHARTWPLLRLTTMPTVQVVLGYLTNPRDVTILTNPAKRDAISEAIVVAVKRLYLLDDDNRPTGTYKFEELLQAERS